MAPHTLSSACPGAANAGTNSAQVFLEVPRHIALCDAPDNRVSGRRLYRPRLTFAVNRAAPTKRLWVKVEGVAFWHAVDITELTTPIDLIARLRLNVQTDRRFAQYCAPIVLAQLLLSPYYTFEDWTADVDAALAAIGLVAV